MTIELQDTPGVGRYWRVLVQPGELVVASGKTLDYSTWIGTIEPNGKINRWTPAASVPRGYPAAADAMLASARARLRADGVLNYGA